MTSNHLLKISLGPVQSFINTARRTRDLWAGSYLLSDLAFSAIDTVQKQKAVLIYPAKAQVDKQFELSKQMIGTNDVEFVGNLSNQILCVLEADPEDLPKLAQAIQSSIEERLQALRLSVFEKMQGCGGNFLESKLFEEQLQDAMEIYVVWTTWDGQDNTYKACLNQLKRGMAARKATRNFAAYKGNENKLKSSLDGFAETILPKKRSNGFKRYLGLSDNEQLDALGVLKRHIGTDERFTALPRLAADGWIEAIKREVPDKLDKLREAYAKVWETNRPQIYSDDKAATSTRGNLGIYSDLPFDGDLLYSNRIAAIKHENKEDTKLVAAIDAFVENSGIKDLWRDYKEPNPYAAMLMADGDRMGEFLDGIQSAEDHRRVTTAIAEFANKVPEIVRGSRGHAVYAGGEDVMALLPLSGVLTAAQCLQCFFNKAMQGLHDLTTGGQSLPTLRVGIAIAHVLDPYSLLRSRAQAAEQLAKWGQNGTSEETRGNALGLILYPRSGAELALRLRFEANTGDFNAMDDWVAFYRSGQLNSRIAFDILEAATRLQKQGISPDVAKADVKRTIARSNTRGEAGEKLTQEVIARVESRLKALECQDGNADYYPALQQLGAELVMARWLTAATQTELGDRA